MAAKKHAEQEDHGESAPLWIISFADLVTLMLSFFVILAAGSGEAVVKAPEFIRIVAALQAAFKNAPAGAEAGVLDPAADFNTLVQRLVALKKNQKPPGRGDTSDKGIPGKSFRVRRLRDGMEITIGGPVFFEPFSAQPTEEGQRQLQQIVEVIRGHRNVIEVRGHAGEGPWPADWTYQDALKLSYARAEFVGNVLLKNGIDPRSIRQVAVGPAEPLTQQAYNADDRAQNRRVEIIVRESTIDQYVGQTPANDTPASAPADETPTSHPAGEPPTSQPHS